MKKAEKVGHKDGSVEDKYLSALLSIYKNLRGEKRENEVEDNFDKVTKEGVFHPVALNLTGILRYHGVYYWKDVEKAREGFVQAQYTLGFNDWAGWSEEEHFFKKYSRQSKPYGPNWLKHAATAGYPPALNLMAVVTYYGVSAYFDPEEGGEPPVLSADSNKSFSGISPWGWAYRA